ncbi:MAG: DMT family transporter [Proteobacteria bacterium]|nr:DMT family transporter [Pseudomonadota bacterium]
MTTHKLALDMGLIYAFGAALLFSFKPVLVKLIYVYELDTITLLAWRMLISAPIYAVIGLILLSRNRQSGKKLEKRWVGKALLIGLVGYYLAALFDLLGLQTITAQLERLILFSYPTWVAVFTWLLLKKPMEKKILLALGLSYIGIAVIFVSDWQQLGDDVIGGALWVLLAALSFSLYVVLSKPIIDQIGAKEFTVIAMISSSLITLVHFFVVQSPQALYISLPAFKLIVLMAIVTTVLPTFMLAAAISHLGPSKTAITGTLGPAMTSLFAVMLLDEYFGWPQAIGLALVIAAIGVMQYKPRATI